MAHFQFVTLSMPLQVYFQVTEVRIWSNWIKYIIYILLRVPTNLPYEKPIVLGMNILVNLMVCKEKT